VVFQEDLEGVDPLRGLTGPLVIVEQILVQSTDLGMVEVSLGDDVTPFLRPLRRSGEVEALMS